MRKLAHVVMAVVLALLPLAGTQPVMAQGPNPPSNQSFVGGKFVAKNYNYTGMRINSGGGSANTTYSISLNAGSIRLPDGRTIVPFSAGGVNILGQPAGFPAIPISVGAGTTQETVTPTAVTGCFVGAANNSCTITAAFVNAHGAGEVVTSGSSGIQEAINDAAYWGGGTVEVDSSEALNYGGAAAIRVLMAAATPIWNVSLNDTMNGNSRPWTPTPTGLALAVPTTLTTQAACDATHQTCSDASVAGSASWGSTTYAAVAYMDCFGNEGPASLAPTVFTSVASKAIDIASPAASAGACGWIPYLSLSGGSYAQAYAIPPTATVCTLSTLTPVPSCAIKNTNYGTVSSTYGAGGLFTIGGAQVITYPVNTGQHFTKLASTVQTTASYTPMTNSSVTYSYAPSNRVGTCGITSYDNTQGIAAGGISASSTAAIPMALGTWTVPAGCFNYIGAEFRVSGKFTWTEGSTSAATYNVVIGWDAAGTNTTTIPLALCTIANTHTPAAAAQNGYYSCTIKVLTTGATGTALVNGWGDMSIATGQALLIGFANDTAVAASGSINLVAPARITVQFFDSGNTVTGAQGLENTLEVLN